MILPTPLQPTPVFFCGTFYFSHPEAVFISPALQSGLGLVTFLANGIFANVIQAGSLKELVHGKISSFGCHSVNKSHPDSRDTWSS